MLNGYGGGSIEEIVSPGEIHHEHEISLKRILVFGLSVYDCCVHGGDSFLDDSNSSHVILRFAVSVESL